MIILKCDKLIGWGQNRTSYNSTRLMSLESIIKLLDSSIWYLGIAHYVIRSIEMYSAEHEDMKTVESVEMSSA